MLTGQCLCGAVAFTVSAPFASAGWCHCTHCRRRTGVHASASAQVEPGSFAITRGEEAIREFAPPGGSAKAFCERCGGHLFARAPDDPDRQRVRVRLGAVDGDPGIRPQYRQYLRSAVPWYAVPDDGLPRYDGPRPRG